MRGRDFLVVALALLVCALFMAESAPAWNSDELICDATGNQTYSKVISSDFDIVSGNPQAAIVMWNDYRNGDQDIYVKKVNLSDGNAVWSPDPEVPIVVGYSSLVSYGITSDGQGGAIIAWVARENGGKFSIYAQGVYSNGTTWGPPTEICSPMRRVRDKINICTSVGDGGGAIIAWEDSSDYRDNGRDIYAQKIALNGARLWGKNGFPVCTALEN